MFADAPSCEAYTKATELGGFLLGTEPPDWTFKSSGEPGEQPRGRSS
jgi:hypothetical protein